jgi:predicted amidohydrolase
MNTPGIVTVAVVSTTPELGAVDNNLAAAADTVRSLAGSTDLIVFPELFPTGYHLTDLDLAKAAEPLDGTTMTELRTLAASTGVAVLGSVVESAGGTVYDTAFVVDRTGELIASYRKTHLHASEVGHFAAGDALVLADLACGLRLGLAICVEHAYPEIFAELALAGAHLVAVPAAVRAGYEHLLTLRTRARAQDNQMFVASANYAGDDGHTAWCGGSLITDPTGAVLATTGDRAGVAVAELRLDRQRDQRIQEPVLARRRPQLYPRLQAGPNRRPAPAEHVDHVERTM